MTKRRHRRKRERDSSEDVAPTRIEPLLCAKCGAPQAVGEEDVVRATKRDDRGTMWTLVATGLLLAPLLCAGGWAMHALLSH